MVRVRWCAPEVGGVENFFASASIKSRSKQQKKEWAPAALDALATLAQKVPKVSLVTPL